MPTELHIVIVLSFFSVEAFSPTLPQCFCSVCVWNPPQGSFESLHGYDVRYFNTDSGDELVLSLSEREFYQVTTTEILSLGEEQQIQVQVSCLI